MWVSDSQFIQLAETTTNSHNLNSLIRFTCPSFLYVAPSPEPRHSAGIPRHHTSTMTQNKIIFTRPHDAPYNLKWFRHNLLSDGRLRCPSFDLRWELTWLKRPARNTVLPAFSSSRTMSLRAICIPPSLSAREYQQNLLSKALDII